MDTNNPSPDSYNFDGLGDYLPGETDNTSPVDGPPRPVDWDALNSDEIEYELLTLNQWVEQERHTQLFDATVIPPYWHRHQALIEQLSALRTHKLAAYDPEQHGSAPFGWLRDLDEWKTRMRELVAQLGCRIDNCRSEAITRWPGEPEPDPADTPPWLNTADRYEDFVTCVLWRVERRRAIEQRYYTAIATHTDSTTGTDTYQP